MNMSYQPRSLLGDCSTNQKENTNMHSVTNHSLLLLKYFFFLRIFEDIVKEENRPRLNQLRKIASSRLNQPLQNR